MHVEDGLELVVHLVFGEPERKRGGVAGKIVNLYAIELLQADVGERYFECVEPAQFLPNADFEFTHALIAYNKEIAAAAGGVEGFNIAESCQQAAQPLDVARVACHVELFIQPVDEERAD